MAHFGLWSLAELGQAGRLQRRHYMAVRMLWSIFGASFLFFAQYSAPAAEAGRPILLMFGKETREPARTNFPGFAYVTPPDKFDEGNQWGFSRTNKVDAWVFDPREKGSVPADVILEHCITCRDGTFNIRVPNGWVAVHVWIGDWLLGLRRLWPNCSFRIQANGKTVVEEKVTPPLACSQRWWLRGESEVYRKNTDTWARLVKPVLDEYEFTVDVTNGVLALKMENVILGACVVVPGADEPEMRAALAKIEQERRSQFANRYPWKPQADEPMPPVSPGDKARGFVLFQKHGDDDVYPWSRPKAGEVTNVIRIFAARGEQEPFRFGILPLKDMKAFTLEAGDFMGPTGARIEAAKCADIWMERFTERGAAGTGGRGSLRGLDPFSDVLLETRPLDFEPGTPRMYTVDLRVPREIPAGDYRAPVVFKSEGKEIARAELFLRVLPWELEFAPVSYSFQPGLMNWPDLLNAREWKAQGLEEQTFRQAIRDRVRFIGKYGFDYSYFNAPWGYGVNSKMKWGTIKGEPGSRHFTQTPEEAAEMDWWYRLIMDEGNARHWIQFHFNHSLFFNAGWMSGKGKSGQGYGNENDTPEQRVLIRKDIVTIIREFDDILKKKGYPKHYYYSCGEPDNFGLAGVEDGIEMAKICREAGVATLCTINGPIAAKMTPPVFDIVMANHGTPITQELIDRVKKCGHQFGSHNTGETRLAAGYQFWRLCGCTKFQEAILYVDYLLPYAYLPWNYKAAKAYPAENRGWRPTVRWLRYRDGRDDFMYMWNLEQRIEKAKTAGLKDAPEVKAAEEFVKEMETKINVDPSSYFMDEVSAIEAGGEGAMGWTAKRYERYRRQVAALVMDIDKVLAKTIVKGEQVRIMPLSRWSRPACPSLARAPRPL